MGHYCRICGRSRPNERFSGRGHRIRVCKACQKLPRAAREYIEIMDELSGYLDQSNVSPKGSVKNNFAELALRFAPDLVAKD